jgi:hypothetical protein
MVPVVARPKVIVGPKIFAWPKVIAWPKVFAWPKVLRASGATPSRSEVIVAATPVPVIAPTRVPEVAWTPGREGTRLGLNLDCGSQTSQT